jgi:hypothetical protein
MKKVPQKPNLLVELTKLKMETQKAGASTEAFRKFQPNKSRNENRSAVGPSWGPRKGN